MSENKVFADRLKKARHCEEVIENILCRFCYSVVKTGHEHVIGNDRYAPDFHAGIERDGRSLTFYVEAKASEYIERDAYLYYRKLERIGHRVILFVKTPCISYVDVHNIHFWSSHPSNKQTLTHDGWLVYSQSSFNMHGSNTPYKKMRTGWNHQWHGDAAFIDFLYGNNQVLV